MNNNKSESQELLRLFKCAVDTGTEVLSAFAGSKLLPTYGGCFIRFLDDKKHEIFHLWQSKKLLCCACPVAGCNIKRTGHKYNWIFKKLYSDNGNEDKGHIIRNSGRVVQVCLHKYIPRNIAMHELDISAISFLLRNLAPLSQNETTALDTVTTYRSKICHAHFMKCYSISELNTAWNELENALVALVDPLYKRLIRKQIKYLQKEFLEKEEITELLNKVAEVNVVLEEVKLDKLETRIDGRKVQKLRTVSKAVEENQENTIEDISRTIQNLAISVKYERSAYLLEPEGTCEDTLDHPLLWQIATPGHWNLETVEETPSNIDMIDAKFKRKGKGTDSWKFPIKDSAEKIVTTDDTYEEIRKSTVSWKFPSKHSVEKLVTIDDTYEEIGKSTVSWRFPIKHAAEKLVTKDDTYEEIRKKVNNLCKVPVSFGLELIIDRRLDDEYRRLIQTNINGLDTKREETYQYMEEFIHMCELRNRYVSTMESIIILTDAVRRVKDLRVRWVLSNFDFENLIGPVFEKISEVKDMEMTKIIAWFITKNLFNTHKKGFDRKKLRIWPGFRCLCKKKDVSLICSNQFEIIIESMKVIEDIPDEFEGFKVRQLPYEKESKEAGIVTNCLSQHWNPEVCCDNIFIPGKDAESLFKNHSNLTLICSSIIKSVGMPYKHKIEKVKCVQLHCTVKRVIPIGENHFPASVCHYPTDVFEGCPLLATGLKVGDKVGTLDPTGNFKSHGTLGGFVNHFGYPCFLTCAHVVFDLETLLGLVSNDIDSNGIAVFTSMNTTNSPVQCGRVMRRVFEHSNIDKTSIDAALVHIIPNITVDSQEIIVDNFGFNRSMAQLGISSMDLNEICIDIASICHSEAELLCPGGFLKIKDKVKVTPPKDYVEIQFPPDGGPVQQGYAKPLMIATTAHMQLSNANLKGQRVFRMYNQLILNLPLQLGDSGTCIYVVDKNKQRGCLGMAIGIISSGQCIFTPLKEILRKLKH